MKTEKYVYMHFKSGNDIFFVCKDIQITKNTHSGKVKNIEVDSPSASFPAYINYNQIESIIVTDNILL